MDGGIEGGGGGREGKGGGEKVEKRKGKSGGMEGEKKDAAGREKIERRAKNRPA
jgi:hypothetical protein